MGYVLQYSTGPLRCLSCDEAWPSATNKKPRLLLIGGKWLGGTIPKPNGANHDGDGHEGAFVE